MAREPEALIVSPPVIFADAFRGVSLCNDAIRLVAIAEAVTEDGELTAMISGQIVMGVTAALELRGKLDQLLGQLEARGAIQLPRGKPQA